MRSTPLARFVSNPSRPHQPRRATLSLLIALNLLNYIDRYILPGEVSLIQREFHSTDQQMGALTTALFFFYMFAAPLTGWLGDRFPRKPLIIAGAVLWSVATLARPGSTTTGPSSSAMRWLAWARPPSASLLPPCWPISIPSATATASSPSFMWPFPWARRWATWRAGNSARVGAGARHFSSAPFPVLLVAGLYGWLGREPERGASDHIKPTFKRTTFGGSSRNPAYLTATFGLAMLTFAMGGISSWVPEFLRRSAGLSVGNASLIVGAITVIDGIAGTLVGGWIAQRWLRTDHRALYLLSFWSVALTLPCGALLFFGPPAWAIPRFFAAEFFLFLNTGPLNAAIVNSVSAPVRATAISRQSLLHSRFGDTFSPTLSAPSVTTRICA